MILHHLNNPFNNAKVSDSNFAKIAQTNLERMRAKNDPAVKGLISPTQAAYNEYLQSLTTEAVEASLKEGKTISVDDTIRLLKGYVSRKEGVIADKFPKGSAEYEEFFPQGLTEYAHAGKKNIGVLFKRFVDKCKAYERALGKELAAEAASHYGIYQDARKAQLQTIGQVKSLGSVSQQKREKLAVQLFVNLLTLLAANAEAPERVKMFYDESMLRRTKTREEISEENTPEA